MGKPTKTGTAALAKVTNITADQIPQAIANLNAKIQELKGEENDSVRITESLPEFGTISDITDIDTLIKAHSAMESRKDAYERSRPKFDKLVTSVKTKPFTFKGHSFEAWEKEIMTQYRKATYSAELAKLTQAKAMLEECLSEEDKRMAKIQNAIQIMNS